MYISIKDGEVIVKCPLFFPNKEVKKIVMKKSKWIYEKIKECSKRQIDEDKNANKIYNKISVLGEEYCVNKIYRNKVKSGFSFCDKTIKIYLPVKCLDSKDCENKIIEKIKDNIYKSIAEEEVMKSLERVSCLTGLEPEGYKIKKLKSTWGICSSKKIITINLRLMEFDTSVIDYVVLHELCHLKHMNHSKSFWGLVSQYMPEYKMYRKILKKT